MGSPRAIINWSFEKVCYKNSERLNIRIKIFDKINEMSEKEKVVYFSKSSKVSLIVTK